jgi:hypothetical protein
MNYLHVIDANCPWVRSFAAAMPSGWLIRHYRIYNPLWLPRGWRDLTRLFRTRRINDKIEEIYLVTPGWRRFNWLSSAILSAFVPALRTTERSKHTILFSFPFYSAFAERVRRRNPATRIAYWAHDAFAFYGFSPGYIAEHEERLVPLCDQRFAMAPQLVCDYLERFPDFPFHLLQDAVSESFLDLPNLVPPPELSRIKKMGDVVVGCIGQINGSYDWDLLEEAAVRNSRTQFIFIGNLFEEGAVTTRIRRFFEKPNVHWLGQIEHERLPYFLKGFDICLNPLAVTAHNHRRDPLRIYDYLTTMAPIYSTDLNGVRMHRDYIRLFKNPSLFVEALGQKPAPLTDRELKRRREYILANTWKARTDVFLHLLPKMGP